MQRLDEILFDGGKPKAKKTEKVKGVFYGVPKTQRLVDFTKKYSDYVKTNPTIRLGKVIPISRFKTYPTEIGYLESGLNPDAINKYGYAGYFGIQNMKSKPFSTQMNAFWDHHRRMINDMVIEDVQAARKKGYNDAEIMAKYHNQGRHSFNYYHNDVDHEDGNGTKISNYGNGLTPVNVLDDIITQKALTGEYYVLKPGESIGKIENRLRIKGVNPSNNQQYLLNINGDRYNGRRNITLTKDKKDTRYNKGTKYKSRDGANVKSIGFMAGDTVYFYK